MKDDERKDKIKVEDLEKVSGGTGFEQGEGTNEPRPTIENIEDEEFIRKF